MAEFAGLGYYAEIPGVIFDVQRTGPSTGMPTRTSQADLLSTAFLSHGDTKHVVLLPGSVKECFEFGYAAFDLAERLQTPVFVLSDLDLGMNNWMSDPFDYPDKPLDRGKVLTAEDLDRLGGFARYRDVDGDAIGWRTLPGTRIPRRLLYARLGTQRRGRLHREAGRVPGRDGAAGAQVRECAQAGSGAGRDGEGRKLEDRDSWPYGSTDFALRESLDQIKKEYGRTWITCASGPIRLRTRFTTLWPRTSAFTWWSRTATRNWPAC
jgi:2-oxoglutarate/2-oxoacid ferredoxin oxidoreductase subunit alpha